MKLTEVILYTMKMRMKTPFITSFGTVQNKTVIIIKATDETGVVGWGEGVAFAAHRSNWICATQNSSLEEAKCV